ncbi:MAG: sigma-70 family RNA polymerase sigma factor [Singulisphaera sp.]
MKPPQAQLRRHLLVRDRPDVPYSAAAKAMEQVLIDHHRHRNARKGPGGLRRTPHDDVLHHQETVENLPVADLNEALAALDRTDERASLVVRMKFFLGMTQPEVAESLGISQKTVERDWTFARAWLHERLKPPEVT